MSEETRLFGTDGIRGKAGDYPLDRNTVEAIGRSLAANLRSELGRQARIVIGRDTRISGEWIGQALAKGATHEGADVQLAGVITTPGVAYIARSTPFDAGVVISASHNPFDDNGIKVFAQSGRKLADAMERRIETDLASGRFAVGGSESPERTELTVNPEYQQRYIRYLTGEVSEGVSIAGLRLGIDCANGAASNIAPQVFARLGAAVEVINADPDGRNINENCGSLHPAALQNLVREKKLDLGIAFDGDADRSLFVDNTGELVDGDHTLLILADFLKSLGRLKENLVVTTVMSNVGLEIALAELGVEMVRTSVGDKYVLDELMSRGASVGGEQSGHIIFPQISLAGDGIITSIEVLRAIIASGKSLAELASKLVKYPQVLINKKVSRKPPIDSLDMTVSAIAQVEAELHGKGRVLVRYSGTENLVRIMIEGQDKPQIEKQAERIAQTIVNEIG